MKTGHKISDIWYTFCPSPSPSHVALAKGWLEDEFAKDGIKLSHIRALPAKEWQVHFTHKHRQLFRDGGNIPPIWTRSEGVDTKVIGMTWLERRHAILVRKSSPIMSVKELQGKRIALLRKLPDLIDFSRATEKRAIIMSLKVHGLTEDSIQFVDIPIDIGSKYMGKTTAQTSVWDSGLRAGWKLPRQPEVEALQSGEVDAMWAYGEEAVILEQAGVARVIYSLNKHPDLEYRVNIDYPYVCTVDADFANERPDLVTRWMKVMVKAGIWAKGKHAEVASISAKASNIPTATLKKSLSTDFHKHLVPETSERGIKALEIEKKFLREHGFINNDFDVRSWIDGSFLDAAMKAAKAESR